MLELRAAGSALGQQGPLSLTACVLLGLDVGWGHGVEAGALPAQSVGRRQGGCTRASALRTQEGAGLGWVGAFLESHLLGWREIGVAVSKGAWALGAAEALACSAPFPSVPREGGPVLPLLLRPQHHRVRSAATRAPGTSSA